MTLRKDLPSGKVTFLFTDIVGSTALLEALGPERYATALSDHRRIVRQASARHGGVEVDTQGDAFFLAFPTASGAVATASEVLVELAAGPIRVRGGIHSGDPFLGDEGYVGPDVHLAARIATAGHGGQILLSAGTRDQCDVAVTELGEHRLKDFADPVALFQLGGEHFPPLRTIANTNLPRLASSFVGREAQVNEVIGHLRSSRLVTLTGPGGIGKTRLAIEAAERLLRDFRAGVFWVDLAALRDPKLALPAAAQTLGARRDLAEHIGEREMLLLFDNFEQVVEAAPDLGQLLRACPNFRALVTSREALRISGETTYPVPELNQSEAVTLFCQRSGLAPDPSISELCRRVDGLPLAVELAAARTAILTPADIVQRISDRLDLFRGGRDAEDRQRTLRATIDWSFQLLDAPEQELFTHLAVFHGGFTIESAEAIAHSDLDMLQSLVDKSLIRHSAGRFWMLETIHEFAVDQLASSPHRSAIASAHLRWVLELVERADRELEGAKQEQWLGRLDLEVHNIRAALQAAVDGDDPDLALRLAGGCATFWWIRGDWTEGRRWLEAALSHSGKQTPSVRAKALEGSAHLAARQGDYERADTLATECLTARTTLDDLSGAARAVRVLGLIASGRYQTDRCRELVVESATLARRADDSWALSMALNNLGYIALQEHEWARAADLLEEATELARRRVDQRGEAFFRENLGLARLGLGSADEARAQFESSAAIALRLGFLEVLVGNFVGLANLEASAGNHVRAARLLGGAARMNEDIGASLDWVEGEFEAHTRPLVEQALGAGGWQVSFDSGHDMDPLELATEVLAKW